MLVTSQLLIQATILQPAEAAGRFHP